MKHSYFKKILRLLFFYLEENFLSLSKENSFTKTDKAAKLFG